MVRIDNITIWKLQVLLEYMNTRDPDDVFLIRCFLSLMIYMQYVLKHAKYSQNKSGLINGNVSYNLQGAITCTFQF